MALSLLELIIIIIIIIWFIVVNYNYCDKSKEIKIHSKYIILGFVISLLSACLAGSDKRGS